MKSIAGEEWLQPTAGSLGSDLSSARPSSVAARGVAQAVPRCGHAERIAVSVKDATESSRIPAYSPASPPRRGPRRRRRRVRAGCGGGERGAGEGRWEKGEAVKWADGHLRYELAMDGLWVGGYLWTVRIG